MLHTVYECLAVILSATNPKWAASALCSQAEGGSSKVGYTEGQAGVMNICVCPKTMSGKAAAKLDAHAVRHEQNPLDNPAWAAWSASRWLLSAAGTGRSMADKQESPRELCKWPSKSFKCVSMLQIDRQQQGGRRVACTASICKLWTSIQVYDFPAICYRLWEQPSRGQQQPHGMCGWRGKSCRRQRPGCPSCRCKLRLSRMRLQTCSSASLASRLPVRSSMAPALLSECVPHDFASCSSHDDCLPHIMHAARSCQNGQQARLAASRYPSANWMMPSYTFTKSDHCHCTR